MPRRKSTPPQDPKAMVDTQALEVATIDFDKEQQRLAQIDSQFGDGLPFDQARIINETRFFLQHAADSMLEAGKRLILLKEHNPHGEWLTTLNDIGIEQRSARRLMQAAVKFSGTKGSLVNLGKSKMIELLAVEDEELEQLAEGGTLAGLTLDKIDSMSVSELRRELRKEKEARTKDNEVHEKLLTQKDAKINELDKQLHGDRRIPNWPELVAETQIQTQTAAFAAMEACDKLSVLRMQILNGDLGELDGDDAEPAIESMAVTYYNSLYQLWGQVGELMADCEEVFIGYKMRADERAANAAATETE